MSFAFTHLFVPWLLGKGYELFKKKELSRWTFFFLVLGGVIPDADYLLEWGLGWDVHRTLTHSLFFIIFGGLLVYFCGKLFTPDSKERKSMALAFSIGIFTHLLLDMQGGPGVPLLWPNELRFTYTSIFLPYGAPGLLDIHSVETLQHIIKEAIWDMGLGTAWMFFLWWRQKLTW